MAVEALAGLKVLDLAWVIAGPQIGRVLADYGATVLRVESGARTDPCRSMGPFPDSVTAPLKSGLFDTHNAGKLGLTLDLGQPDAQDVVRDLVKWADVVTESFAAGQLARWGLSMPSLRAINPRAVLISTNLMGQTGPLAPVVGFGNVGASVSGFQTIVGHPGALPVGPFGPYTDFVGPRYGLLAVLAAVEHQRATGEGCWIDVSQAEAGIQFLAAEVAQGAATGRYAEALGNRDPQFAPHGVFPSQGDDDWVAIVARDDEDWAKLAEVIGGDALDQAFETFAGRKAEEDRLEAIIGAWTAQRDAGEVEEHLQSLGVPAHKAASGLDVIADPQLAEWGMFKRLPRPDGSESVIETSRFRMSETPATYHRPAPFYGRDNRTALVDFLGYDDAKIAALEAAGALK